MKDTSKAVEVSNLSKVYGDHAAVDDISFSIQKGEIFGILGPNGAGKTTTTHILETLTSLSSGSAEVNGFSVVSEKEDVRSSIGAVFQEPSIDDRMSGRENMMFHGRMYGLERDTMEERIDRLLELVELKEHEDKIIEDYSGGMKRRLELARGLLHRPDVLFLDEPTLGLDAETRRRIWKYIQNLNRDEDMTIILTTHYMEEADFLCDRIAIMQDGEIVSLESPSDLKEMMGESVTEIELKENVESIITELESKEWIKSVKHSDRKISITSSDSGKNLEDVLRTVREEGGDIEKVDLKEPSLEDVFLHVTGKTIKEGEEQ